jgi:hypothetical protein
MKKSLKKLNAGMINAILTTGGEDPAGTAKEKSLKIAGLAKVEKSTISHRYSAAYNEWVKIVRFYVHVTQIAGKAPVLWLSRNQYKTCRNGHKCFWVTPMTEHEGKHEAKWRNMTFTVDSARTKVVVHSVNNGNEFDVWSGTKAKSSEAKTLSLCSK